MTNLLVAIIYIILITIVSMTIFFASVRDGHKLVTKHLIRLCVLVVGWQVVSALVYMAQSDAFAVWAFDAKLAFVAFAPVQLLLLGVKFYSANRSRRVTLVFAFLCIVPAVTAALALTGPLHHLIRSELYLLQSVPVRIFLNVRGSWFWVHTAYSYMLMVASIILILYQHSKLPRGYRVPSLLVAAGSLVALFSNFFELILHTHQAIDMTVIGLSAALVLTYAGIALSDESSLLIQAFDDIFSYLEDYIFVLNKNKTIMEMNPAARRWLQDLGIQGAALSFHQLLGRLAPVGGEREDDAGHMDFQLTVNGHTLYFNLMERPISDHSGRTIGTFAMFTNITRYRLLIERIEHVAGIDPLTNLGNRLGYERALKRLDEPASLPFSIILGDVNSLKAVNDSLGHAAGDDLLRTIARILGGVCPEDGGVYRIGGDEFVLLLPRVAAGGAREVMAGIRQGLVKANLESPYQVSIALGTATKETREQSLPECIAKADRSMYMNKKKEGYDHESDFSAGRSRQR